MSKKIDKAQIVISDKIDSELLGVFANSVYLTNYEFTYKTDPKDIYGYTAKSESEDEDADPRKDKVTKRLASVIISTKDSANILTDSKYAFWVAAARSAELSRNLGNTRATVADPDFMEQQVRNLIEGKP